MGYRIYRNLHKKEWTVQNYVPGKGWRKLVGARCLSAPKTTFKVYERGQERVRQEKAKNVHAFALVDHYTINDWEGLVRLDGIVVGYNPYKHDGFYEVERDIDNVSAAFDVVFSEDGLIRAQGISFVGGES